MRRFAGAVAVLHLTGWGLLWWYSRRYAALTGLGTLAYTLGLRHGFDADHIAAIDATTRKLLQEGKRPFGVGFFFSLGHSTVVFVLVGAFALGAGSVSGVVPVLQGYGGYLGAGVSGSFLWLVGILNLVLLIHLVRAALAFRDGDHDRDRLERQLLDRGVLNRFFARRIGSRIGTSWHMYPVGLLFGLSFDTASEVALLALAAQTASHPVQLTAVMALPVLFVAGMSLVDTSVGAFMRQAYGWSFHQPLRRLFFNITLTGLSVVIALGVGTVELLQLALGDEGWAAVLDRLGYAVVVVSALAWVIATFVWVDNKG
jgi:high-affinity nickel-transport protein